MRSALEPSPAASGLNADELDELFAHLKNFRRLALAVSGGADSLSLLFLFDEWRRRNNWRGDALVLTVDHGLRPESRNEAEYVAETCRSLGLPHKLLIWTGGKPASNRQAAARAARYELMANALAETDAEALLLGHHLNDQAETFLDRLTRGSGVYGLGAMAPDEPDGPEGLRLLRPFLPVPKARLQASLKQRGIAWCEDPSNSDQGYKRSRLRRIAGLLGEEGLSEERIFETARILRRSREALETYRRREYDDKVVEHPAGPVKISLDAYAECPADIRLRLLSEMICRTTLDPAPIRSSKLEAFDLALLKGGGFKSTLAGAVLELNLQTIWIWKEAGRHPPSVMECSAGEGVWDGRYLYTIPEIATGERLFLGPLSAAPVRYQDIDWPSGWPKASFETAPVVWDGDGSIVRMPFGSSVDLPGFALGLRIVMLRKPRSVANDANR